MNTNDNFNVKKNDGNWKKDNGHGKKCGRRMIGWVDISTKTEWKKKESQTYTHINKRMKTLLDIANVFRLHFI